MGQAGMDLETISVPTKKISEDFVKLFA